MARKFQSQPKKKTSKFTLILYFLIAVFAIGGVSSISDGKIGEGLLGVALAVVCLLIRFWPLIARKKKAVKPVASHRGTAHQTLTTATPQAINPRSVPVVLTIPHASNGYELAYQYEDVPVAGAGHYDVSSINPGSLIKFKLEPENQYDVKAVSLHVGDIKIGYLPRNKLQDMAHDFLSRGGDIAARVTAVEGQTVKIVLGYYEHVGTPYENLIDSGAQCKSYKLTGNTSEAMQENLFLCSIGEEVDVDFDYEKDKYLAASMSTDIGYFPKSASSALEGSFRAFIANIDTDDNGKYFVIVSVFPQ